MRNRLPALLAAAALTLTGCGWIVGDSVSYLTAQRLHDTTGATVRAGAGRSLTEGGWGDPVPGLDAIETSVALSEPGEWIVVQLGANDTWRNPPDQWRPTIAAAVALVPDDRGLAWVLPVNLWTPGTIAATGRFAEIVAEEIEAHPHHAIVDWRGTVLDWPALVYDGVHPTPFGGQVLAFLIDLVTWRSSVRAAG